MSSKRPRTPWSSSEGQADYFATLKCLRHLFLNDNNSQIISKAIIPNALKQGCLKSHPNKDDRDICIRSGLAASTVTKFFSALEKVPAPKFETPDLEVVAETNDFHPNSQCRLDTFFAGALCDRSLNENLSQEDEVPSTCHSLLGDVIGLRPRCWFKPREG